MTAPAVAVGFNLGRNNRRYFQDFVDEIGKIENATVQTLIYAIQPIREATLRYVPVKTGRLRSSFYIIAGKYYKSNRVTLGYARYGFPKYAQIVHDRLYDEQGNLIRHKSPTKALFLELAIQEHLSEILPRAQYFLRNFMRK